MPKDSLLHARLQREGLGRTYTPTCPDAATLCLAHDPAYVQAFLDGSISTAAMRQIGLPWSPALVQRTLVGVGSAVLAARLALQLGLAVMCNGGTHHAHHGHGSGVRGGQGAVAVEPGWAAGEPDALAGHAVKPAAAAAHPPPCVMLTTLHCFCAIKRRVVHFQRPGGGGAVGAAGHGCAAAAVCGPGCSPGEPAGRHWKFGACACVHVAALPPATDMVWTPCTTCNPERCPHPPCYALRREMAQPPFLRGTPRCLRFPCTARRSPSPGSRSAVTLTCRCPPAAAMPSI